MSSPSPSSSPRWDSAWDNRNSGFISPSQLQLWRQQQQEKQHDFRSQPAESSQSPAPSQPNMFRTTSRPGPTPAQGPVSAEPPPTHSRTMSHFSFFSLSKNKPNHNSQPSTSSVTTLPNVAPTGRVDEFGSQARAPGSSLSQTLPRNDSAASQGNGPTSPSSYATQVAGDKPTPPPPGPPVRSNTGNATASSGPPLHPEIRSVLSLILAHGRKIYFSGPLVHHDEREPDGTRSKDDGWHDVFAQLGGTTLSLWNMKEIEEASKQGRQVPPKYINIQDAFIAVLGSVTVPATDDRPAKKYTNVLTLITAGVNLKLFACPSTQSLLSWTAALRLAAYEKARLEEIYTAHLLRTRIDDAARAPTPLSNGRMECRVRARIAGRTDWKTLWMVVSAGLGGHSHDNGSVSSMEKPIHATKKNRLSALFNRDHSPPRGPATARPTIQFFVSNKQKDMKRALLTVRDVTQAFAVYPERPDLIDQASLLKVEGSLGDEEAAGSLRNAEGWVLLIPEPDGNRQPAVEMRKILVGIHDAFALYGRPRLYNWDPRDPRGMMFAYPVGENKDQLFLDRELAENLDPRDDRTSANRAQLQHILWDRMRGSPAQSQSPTSVGDRPPTLPPLPDMTLNSGGTSAQFSSNASAVEQPMQLPPLQFERSRNDYDLPAIPAASPGPAPGRTLTPITEASDPQNSRSLSGGQAAASSSQPNQSLAAVTGELSEQTETNTFLGGNLSSSPLQSPALSGPAESDGRRRLSDDSWGFLSASRPESKQDHLPGQTSSPSPHHPSFGSDSSKPMFIDISRELGVSGTGSTSQSDQRQGSPALQHQTTAGGSRIMPTDTGRNSPHLGSPQQPPPMNRQGTSSSFHQGQPYPSATKSMSVSGGRDSPFRPPSQQASPAPRIGATYMNRDASLPPPPSEDEEPAPPPPRRGVELSDPPTPASPRFSILTSPHSVSSPVSERPERQSMFRDAAPSPRQSIASFSNPQPGDIPSPKRPTVHSPAPAPASIHPQSPLPSASPSVRSFNQHPSANPSAQSPRLAQSPSTSQQSPRHVQSPSMSQHKSPSRADSTHDQDILREAGALYYMRHIEQNQPTGPRRPPPPPDDGEGGEDETESESGSSYSPTNPGFTATSPLRTNTNSSNASPPLTTPSSYGPPRGGTPVVLGKGSNKPVPVAPSPEKANSAFAPRMAGNAVRKPSGARAAPVSKTVAQRDSFKQRPPSIHQPPSDVDEDSEDNMSDHSDDIPQGQRQLPPRLAAAAAHQDYEEHADAVDALAALSYLEIEESQPPVPPQKPSIPPPPPIPQVVEPRATSPTASQESGIRSSFAPSKSASQRKAQAQAQQAASQAAMNKPGKSGKPHKLRDPGAWGESSDEEEEEEEEEDDDDDADSDVEPPQRGGRPMDQRSLGPSGPPSVRGLSPGRPAENGGYPQGRQRRDLPQVPPQSGLTPPDGSDESGAPRRLAPDQYTEAGRRSMYPDAPRRQPSPGMPRQPEMLNPGAARQNVWSQALERDNAEPVRDTFVQLEPPSQTMTKAFAPHGLLYAGMQDKQDRSAKRQEELARETGASLINVPNKPPPPQTGLLGAVSAHERERKREGGLGAALTEREREKRMAEERQRKLDDFQKMQLEQMQQGGSMYGGMGMAPQFTGYNPMMNPMMMGMNPMMTGWGYPGMMNPQHMFAAQQAAQAYQQAMVAFSTAGSQMGGGEGGQPAAPLNPMMTGGGMMGGYDPRMSMMMPMMTGMNPNMTGLTPNMTGMNPNMTGMNPNMTGMNPNMAGMNMNMGQGMNPGGMGLGMQMTGGSGFDVRFPPGNEGGNPQPPYSSQNSSANGQGSPAGPRSQDPADDQSKRDDLR